MNAKLLAVMEHPSDGEIIAMANDVFSDQKGGRKDNDLFYIRFAELLAERQAEACATVAELIDSQTIEDLGEIRAAMEKAHSVCTDIVKKCPGMGALYSRASTAAWQLTNALKRIARIEAVLARANGSV